MARMKSNEAADASFVLESIAINLHYIGHGGLLMRGRIALVGVVAACGVVASSLAAQGTREPDVLPALLTEVRGLRQAMEQMAAAGPRVQLALGRLQLQEQRLNTMIRRLEGVRDSAAGAEQGVSRIQAEVARMQENVKAAEARGDDGDARGFTYEMGQMKRQLALAQQELQRWQGEEAQLQQQIGTEQGRWSEINRTLEELERALGRR
jgi:predicted  nucleic acid-binding Zn-ribbon protein